MAKPGNRTHRPQRPLARPQATTQAQRVTPPADSPVLEYTQSPSALRVDRDAGIIHGVKLVGTESKNGGKYPLPMLNESAPLYEGAKCNINHPPNRDATLDRDAEDRFGIYRNVRVGEDGLYADLHYLKTHPMAEPICEAAERMPEAFGISHNANTVKTRNPDGSVTHQKITRVRSADIVADPATTSSIFESENRTMDATNSSADTMVTSPDATQAAPAADPIENDPFDAVLDAIEQQYMPKIRDKSTDKATRKKLITEMGKKIDVAIKLLADEDPDEEPEETPPADDAGAEEAEECTKEAAKPAATGKAAADVSAADLLAATSVLESCGVPVTTARIKAVAKADAADREPLAKSWLPATASATRTLTPKPRSGSVLESQQHQQVAATASTAATKELTEDSLKRDAAMLRAAGWAS